MLNFHGTDFVCVLDISKLLLFNRVVCTTSTDGSIVTLHRERVRRSHGNGDLVENSVYQYVSSQQSICTVYTTAHSRSQSLSINSTAITI